MKCTFVIAELKDVLKHLGAMKKSSRERDKIVTITVFDVEHGGRMSVERSAAGVNLSFKIPINVEEAGSFSCRLDDLNKTLKNPLCDIGLLVSTDDSHSVTLWLEQDSFVIETFNFVDEVPRGDGKFTDSIAIAGTLALYLFYAVLPPINPDPFCQRTIFHFCNLKAKDGTLLCQSAEPHRIHRYSDTAFKKDINFDCLLPFNIVASATKLLAARHTSNTSDVIVSYSDDIISLAYDNFVLRTKRRHDAFLDIDKVIGQTDPKAARIVVDTNQLLNVLKQMCALVAKNPYHTVEVSKGEDVLRIAAFDHNDKQIASSSVAAFVSENLKNFRVNVNYLIDALNMPIHTKNIVISISGDGERIRINDDCRDEDFIAIVAAIRIKEKKK